jgi:hypothetical protein
MRVIFGSVGEERVDAGFAVAVATYQFGAQGVEAIEPLATVSRDASLKVADGIGQYEEFSIVEVFQPTEVVLGAHCIKLLGQGVVAQIFGGAWRASRATSELLAQHAADLRTEIGIGTSVAARVFALHEVETSLGNAACVRHHVVLVLQLLAQRAQFVERQISGVRTDGGVGVGHVDPPETGGSTATSSCAPTMVSRATSLPLTQIRQVASTSANPDP